VHRRARRSSLIATKFVNVVIETRGEYTIGRTVVDHEKRTKRAPNCHVAFAAERDEFSLS
jgi:inosine-uridine nucleoside N-ribohydrolase